MNLFFIWLISGVLTYLIQRQYLKLNGKDAVHNPFPLLILFIFIPIFGLTISLCLLIIEWISKKDSKFNFRWFYRLK